VLPGTEEALVAELAVTCWRRTGRISMAVLWLTISGSRQQW